MGQQVERFQRKHPSAHPTVLNTASITQLHDLDTGASVESCSSMTCQCLQLFVQYKTNSQASKQLSALFAIKH